MKYFGEKVHEGDLGSPQRKRGAEPWESSEDDSDDSAVLPPAPKRAAVDAKATVFVDLPDEPHDRKKIERLFEGCGVASAAVVREKQGGPFRFKAAPGASAEDVAAVATFRPNRSPEEVLRAGAFGGTYFRTIKSGVLKETLTGAWRSLPQSWIKGLNPATHLAAPWSKYDQSLNKFGVKSGTTLEDWESSGWITSFDPFGWFQWYCRFFQGRRCPDDARQIGRWLKCCGPTGRWKGNLCAKIVVARASFDDPSVSPVVRQTLLHWAYELSEEDFVAAQKKLSKGKGAYLVNKGELNAALKKT